MAVAVYFAGEDIRFYDGTNEVNQVVKLSCPETEVEVRELPPYLGQTVEDVRIIPIKKNGGFTLTLLDDGTNANAFRAKIGTTTSSEYSCKTDDGTTDVVTYDAWVTKVGESDVESANELNTDVEFRLDGTSTWA